MGQLRTIADVKALSRNGSSRFFFAADSMRTWNSVVLPDVFQDGHGGAYFVTGEHDDHGTMTDERYTVRHIDKWGNIGTVDFRAHAEASDALQQACVFANDGLSVEAARFAIGIRVV